jgi:hypothetical protein
VTTVVSPGAEARAGALGARAGRAQDWLADQLAAPLSFDLFVLDEGEWAGRAEVPVYPDELPVYPTFCRAGCDVPPSRVAYSELVDMARSFEDGGFANYVWYQFRLIVAAERLWSTHGVEALQPLQAGEVDVAAEVERNRP